MMVRRPKSPRRPANRWIGLLLGLILLTGCTQLAPATEGVPATRVPTAIPIFWDARAAVTLIQADRLTLPLSDVEDVALVPTCALYGDRRVRWVEPPDPASAPDALGRLWESPVDGPTLDSLIPIIGSSGFFDLAPSYGVDSGPVRRLTIRLEGRGTYSVQVSDATVAPQGYRDLFDLCWNLRQPDQAVEIVPDAGWVYAFPADRAGQANSPWPPDGPPPLSLLADSPRWLEGDFARALWTSARDFGAEVTYTFLDQPYHVALRVPGITPETPRKPRNLDEPPPPTTLWTVDQLTPVFTIRLAGGMPTPGMETIGANVVDLCTIYGDGRVVISEQPIGVVQEGHLGRSELDDFLAGWINSGFFDATPLPPDAPLATPTAEDAVTQVVTISLNDGRDATQWSPLTTSYRHGVRNPCANITSFTPVELEGGYLWAEELGPLTRYEDTPDYALVQWPDDLPELDRLIQPIWYEDNPERGLSVDAVTFAWENLHGGQRRPAVLFVQKGLAFQVNVDVPAVTARPGGVLGASATAEPREP